MVLYFHSILESTPGTSTTCLSWHEQHEVIAIGLDLLDGKRGVVNIYSKEGLLEHNGPALQRNSLPTSLCWHPSKMMLAVGWSNGEVLLWNDEGKDVHEVPCLHTTIITTLKWTCLGSRLGSGDKEGVFAAWKVDAKGWVQHDPCYKQALSFAITDCVCKSGPSGDGDPDLRNIVNLARAAVSGDESALDMFADYNKGLGSRIKLPLGKKEGLNFYVGLANGSVYYINDNGGKSEIIQLDSAIQQLLYCEENASLLAISENLQVVRCRAHVDGLIEELDRVKFSGVVGSAQMTWAGASLLAIATSDQSLRMWDLASGDNFSLLLKESCGFSSKECVRRVAYCCSKGVLAAISDHNKMAIWRKSPALSKGQAEDRWQLLPAIPLNLPCLLLQWCKNHPTLVVGGKQGSLLLTEQKSKSALSYTMVATQSSPKHVVVDIIGIKSEQNTSLSGITMPIQQPLTNTGVQVEFDTDIAFKGLAVSSEKLAVWDGHNVMVYEVTTSGERFVANFLCESCIIGIHDESVFSVEKPKDAKDKPKIQVHNFQGTVKQLLYNQENEGVPHLISTCDNFMTMASDNGYIRVYDLSRRDAKPHCNSKNLLKVIPELGLITSAVCNASGSKVAILCNKVDGLPDSKVYVYDVELDKIESFDFLTGSNDMEDSADSGPRTEIEKCRDDAALDVAGRYPITVHWDVTESRLLCCEAQINDQARKNAVEKSEQKQTLLDKFEESLPMAEVMIVSLFSTQDHGVMLQDSFELSSSYDQLIGLKVPYFYFSNLQAHMVRRTMRDFVGLDDCDLASQSAMLHFSYNVTIGDMDEAFKAIKLIKGVAVWESMARMCVKTRRLDVAKVCLANMGHARGARALRDAEKEQERDARVARLAVELGMNDDAERLYKSCERHDLLNLFYQATGQWGKALDTASQDDRVHLRTTFFKYAKHLEASGDIAGAIPNYEKSGNHYFEVPRMLFDETQMLEAYIMKSKDRKLRKWWAQYMESTGEMETALKFYKQAADPLSLVRVYCYCGNVEKAAEVANETGDRAACYHLARQYENNDDIKQAIHFFTRAMTFGNAIRICKEHGFEDQLMNLALLSLPSDMVEAAKYYEERSDTVDKAVMLYHKAGHFSEALALAFESEQFTALELISQELDDRTDPVLLERCADFFTEHQQYDQAVAMLLAAKRYEEAISICDNHNVRLNEKLVEKLTIPKDYFDKVKRDSLLIKLADCCVKQGEYHIACQKYTQAGDKEKAMRALLKSGDTEKIIFFAGVSRAKSIYVMAANYLQSLDWRKDPDIMKNIISFYTKGRALVSLAGFYDACAQVEIDEYQNYEKALGALSEAFKCLTKAKLADKQQQESKITELKARIALVKKFLQTRRLFESNPEEGIKQCHSLLMESDLDASVRYGDVYGLLIEYYAGQEAFDKAYQFIQELRKRIPAVVISYFVNVTTIEAVHRAVGAPLGQGVGLGNMANGDGRKVAEESDDEVQEEILDGGFEF